MSRCLLVAELATGHGGDVGLAEAMIAAAADAGADYVKTQSYTLEKLNPRDPQAEWLRQSHLDEAAHVRLKACAEQQNVRYMSTPFDAEALHLLRQIGAAIKIASSESGHDWWRSNVFVEAVSWPWGKRDDKTVEFVGRYRYHLTAIPLYPTPMECVVKAPLLDGWSDHCIGLSACYRALALGAKMLEVHLTIPDSRCMPWDKTAEDIRRLRDFAEDLATMSSGVSRQYRERWRA